MTPSIRHPDSFGNAANPRSSVSGAFLPRSKPQTGQEWPGYIRERLMYDVKAGKKIKLTFANTDVMPHNLLVTKPGKADAVINAAVIMGAAGFEKGFIPASDDVLHHTKLLDMSKEEVLEFTLPTAGDYPFVCSFPGHGILMRGVLKAK
ncbi:MAG: hypothetical protein JNN17_05935 [Verrucomicrobiaceae bacterium]|nr:hypothetical protein [Verrucomicrobiaceae bacterium]